MSKILDYEQKQANRQAKFLKSSLLQGLMGAQFDRLRSIIGRCNLNIQQVHFIESYSNLYARLDANIKYEEAKKWGQGDYVITIFSIDEIYEKYLAMAERTKYIKDFAWSLNSDATALMGQYHHVKKVQFEDEEIQIRACFTFEMPVPSEVYSMLQSLGKIVKEHSSNSYESIRVTC